MKQDYLGIKRELNVNKKKLSYYSLKALQEKGFAIDKLPFSIRILLENALRNFDDYIITSAHIDTLLNWKPNPADEEKNGTEDQDYQREYFSKGV